MVVTTDLAAIHRLRARHRYSQLKALEVGDAFRLVTSFPEKNLQVNFRSVEEGTRSIYRHFSLYDFHRVYIHRAANVQQPG